MTWPVGDAGVEVGGGLADCFYCMELLLVGRRFLYHTESSETGNVKGKKKKKEKGT